MGLLRAYWRLLAFFGLTAYYALKLMLASAILGKTPKRGTSIRQQWAIASLNALNVKVELKNEIPPGAHLFLSNHRSYIDGALLPRYILGSIIIKKEVGSWPILGYGARASFSIMIDRKDKDSRRHTREQMVELLKQGYSVTIFPEGTTTAAPNISPLRPGPFQIAMDGGFTVVPVAVEYKDLADAWVGDDTFIRHFLECFQKKAVYIKVKFGEPMLVPDWEVGLKQVQVWMETETQKLREEFDREGR